MIAKQIITSIVLIALINLTLISHGLPLFSEEIETSSESEEFLNGPINVTNFTSGPKDLYVIRTTVYEVGILTEAGNDTDNSTDTTNEEIDLTFFNPKHNGNTIDLSHIPAPIQTNISGVTITGIAPVNFGSIQLPTQQQQQENHEIIQANHEILAENHEINAENHEINQENHKTNQDKGVLPLNVPILPNALISITHNISTLDSKRGQQLLSHLSPILGFTPYTN